MTKCSKCGAEAVELEYDAELEMNRLACSNPVCSRHGVAFTMKAWEMVNSGMAILH
jgi:hypothetical protein